MSHAETRYNILWNIDVVSEEQSPATTEFGVVISDKILVKIIV